jgi:hypothetical protein
MLDSLHTLKTSLGRLDRTISRFSRVDLYCALTTVKIMAGGICQVIEKPTIYAFISPEEVIDRAFIVEVFTGLRPSMGISMLSREQVARGDAGQIGTRPE